MTDTEQWVEYYKHLDEIEAANVTGAADAAGLKRSEINNFGEKT